MYADPDKVAVVRTWPKPTNVKEVQQFMGLVNCYASCICNFADIAVPLTHTILPKRSWVWGHEKECAFHRLHKLLCNPPLLHLPDLTCSFIVDTETCVNATSAIML